MGDGLTWPNKFDIMPLDNLNINDNNTIDNCNNEIENKLNTEININLNNNENDNTADEKIIKNDSYHRNISPINFGSERTLSTQRFSSNYSKYNVVKRNSGNCNSNFTGFETNDTKKTYSGKNEDNVPK